jgi:hypothetical protein
MAIIFALLGGRDNARVPRYFDAAWSEDFDEHES